MTTEVVKQLRITSKKLFLIKKKLHFELIRLSEEERRVDALALRADEGRDKLR